MTMFLWILQWAVSLVAVGAYFVLVYRCFKEYGGWGVAFLVFPPALLFVYVPTRWRSCWAPALVFVAFFAGAMILQRARLGYWAWPDVGRGA